MAKSTSTTKAKTKTTKKKPVTKAPVKKQVAKKKVTATKATTKAVVAKQASSKAKPKVKITLPSGLSRFARLNLVGAGLFLILAALTPKLMGQESVQLFLGHLTKNELASRTETVFAPAAQALYDVQFQWLLVVTLVISAGLMILRATKFRAQEEAGLTSGVQKYRWVDFGVTTALFFEIVALLNGLQDVLAIKFGILSILTGAFFAWMFEREKAATGKPAKASLIGATVALVFPLIAIATTMVGTYVYGIIRAPWVAYAAFAILAVGILLNLRTQWDSYRGVNNTSYLARMYEGQHFVMKLALVVVLLVGLQS